MKTPLSTIMMVQDMLKSGRLDSKPEIKNKYMSIAESETDHLLTLTNKILTISKLENHKLEMNKTEVELTPIIEKLTEKFKAKAQKPVNFIISLQAKTAYADKDHQILKGECGNTHHDGRKRTLHHPESTRQWAGHIRSRPESHFPEV